MTIERFRHEYYFLSNMYPIDPPGGINVGNGLTVPTVEHIYKASRFTEMSDKTAVLGAPNGFAAKNIADKLEKGGASIRAEWSKLRLPVMRASVALKFGQNPVLAGKLVETGNEELVEGTRGEKYSFWGVAPIGSRNGLNWLGKILMDTRQILNGQLDTTGLHPERILNDASILAPENIDDTPIHYMARILMLTDK